MWSRNVRVVTCYPYRTSGDADGRQRRGRRRRHVRLVLHPAGDRARRGIGPFTFPAGTYWHTVDSGGLDWRLTAYEDGSNRSVASVSADSTAFTATASGTPESGDVPRLHTPRWWISRRRIRL